MSNQSTSSRTTLILMAAGAAIVAALVVWALTRTVSPSPVASAPVESYPVVTADTAATTQTTAAGPITQEVKEENHAAAPRVSVEDLRAEMNRNEVVVIDVRGEEAFIASHIPGAINIPLARVESEMSTLPKDKPIVTYCT